MRVVLDSSMALTWCLPQQGGVFSDAALVRVKTHGAIVPPIWRLEMANVLGLKLRDGNISPGVLRDGLRLLDTLDIRTDDEFSWETIAAAIGQVLRFDLAVYDDLYVELAVRSGCALATFDRAMIGSARRFGVEVLPAN
jgi:predicted nucleic acid-binding protein